MRSGVCNAPERARECLEKRERAFRKFYCSGYPATSRTVHVECAGLPQIACDHLIDMKLVNRQIMWLKNRNSAYLQRLPLARNFRQEPHMPSEVAGEGLRSGRSSPHRSESSLAVMRGGDDGDLRALFGRGSGFTKSVEVDARGDEMVLVLGNGSSGDSKQLMLECSTVYQSTQTHLNLNPSPSGIASFSVACLPLYLQEPPADA